MTTDLDLDAIEAAPRDYPFTALERDLIAEVRRLRKVLVAYRPEPVRCVLCGAEIEHIGRGTNRWRDDDFNTACPVAMGFQHRPEKRPDDDGD